MRDLPENPADAVKVLAEEIRRLNGKVAGLEAYVASLHGTVTRDPAALRRFADHRCKDEPTGAAAAEYDWACATLNTLMQSRWSDPRS